MAAPSLDSRVKLAPWVAELVSVFVSLRRLVVLFSTVILFENVEVPTPSDVVVAAIPIPIFPLCLIVIRVTGVVAVLVVVLNSKRAGARAEVQENVSAKASID